MLLRRLRLWAGLLLILTCPEAVAAQGVVRLSSTEVTQTFSADGDTALLANTAFYASLRLDIDGSMTGTVTVSCSVNGSTYDAIPLNGPSPAVTADTDGAVTVPGQYTATIAGCSKVKAVASGWSAGTPSVTLRATSSGGSSGGSSSGGGGGGTTTDPDDASIAVSQTNDNVNALTNVYDGSVWRRLTIGTAGTASAQVLTVQGIASGTNLNVTCSNCSGTGVSVNEDVASANADPGTPAYAVRNDTVTGATGTDGDYQPLKSDAAGRLYTTGTGGTFPATQSGTWTMQPGNTANTTAWLVTNTAIATTDAAIGASPVVIAVGGRASTATPSAISADNDAQAIWLDTVGRVHTVAEAAEDSASADAQNGLRVLLIRDDTLDARSGTEGDFEWFHADANGGLWTHDVNSLASLTALQLIDDPIATLGTTTYTETTSKANIIAAVRRDADTTLVDTTNEVAPLQVNAGGQLKVACITGCSGGTQFAEDLAHTSTDAGTFALVIRRDTTPSSSAGTAGDYTAMNADANGRLYTNTTLYNSSGTELTGGVDYTHDGALTVGTTAGPAFMWRASTATPTAVSASDDAVLGWADLNGRPHTVTEGIEDAAETAAGFLNMAGTVRRDTAASSAGTTGDNATLNTDAVGKLWVSGAFAEDAAHTTADIGIFTLGRRIDTLAASSGTSGDYEAFNMNAVGALWTTPTPSTNGGLSIYRSIDLDEGTGEVVKASPGQVYSMWVTNTATATRFIKIYDATSCTMGTGTPVITIGIPGNSSDDVAGSFGPGGMGIAFATGICFGATTAVADNDTGAPGANDVIANVFYK